MTTTKAISYQRTNACILCAKLRLIGVVRALKSQTLASLATGRKNDSKLTIHTKKELLRS